MVNKWFEIINSVVDVGQRGAAIKQWVYILYHKATKLQLKTWCVDFVLFREGFF